jgi:hypothetical protein
MRLPGMMEDLRYRHGLVSDGIQNLERLARIRRSPPRPAMKAILRDLRMEQKRIDQAMEALERLGRHERSKRGRNIRRLLETEPAGRRATGETSSLSK